jgi:hypothetical protein
MDDLPLVRVACARATHLRAYLRSSACCVAMSCFFSCSLSAHQATTSSRCDTCVIVLGGREAEGSAGKRGLLERAARTESTDACVCACVRVCICLLLREEEGSGGRVVRVCARWRGDEMDFSSISAENNRLRRLRFEPFGGQVRA